MLDKSRKGTSRHVGRERSGGNKSTDSVPTCSFAYEYEILHTNLWLVRVGSAVWTETFKLWVQMKGAHFNVTEQPNTEYCPVKCMGLASVEL